MPRSFHIRAYSSTRSSAAAGIAPSEWLMRYVVSRRIGGQEREASFDVTRNEPPRLFEIVSHAGPVRVWATFELTAVERGARVDLSLVLELGGALRFAGRMVRGRAEREARENLELLKALLEQSG